MNRQQLKKAIGQHVRLQPPATDSQGNVLDDDWLVRSVTDDTTELVHVGRAVVALVGNDHIYSYFSDRARGTTEQRYGYLQLLSQLGVDEDGTVSVEPLPPPRLAAVYRPNVPGDAGPPQSSTLAALRASGVSFTGGEWERPFARALLDQTLPLRVRLEGVRNIGSGATPGLWLRGVNEDAETVRGAALKLLDVVLWNEARRRFVETQDIHQNGPFRELETGKADLFCSQSADLGFIRVEDDRLRIDGGRDGGWDYCRIGTPGIWKLVGRIVAPDGRRCDTTVCFEWGGKGIPMPVACPL